MFGVFMNVVCACTHVHMCVVYVFMSMCEIFSFVPSNDKDDDESDEESDEESDGENASKRLKLTVDFTEEEEDFILNVNKFCVGRMTVLLMGPKMWP